MTSNDPPWTGAEISSGCIAIGSTSTAVTVVVTSTPTTFSMTSLADSSTEPPSSRQAPPSAESPRVAPWSPTLWLVPLSVLPSRAGKASGSPPQVRPPRIGCPVVSTIASCASAAGAPSWSCFAWPSSSTATGVPPCLSSALPSSGPLPSSSLSTSLSPSSPPSLSSLLPSSSSSSSASSSSASSSIATHVAAPFDSAKGGPRCPEGRGAISTGTSDSSGVHPKTFAGSAAAPMPHHRPNSGSAHPSPPAGSKLSAAPAATRTIRMAATCMASGWASVVALLCSCSKLEGDRGV
mmetsp:Transcript_24453/g.62396  ORF Transcript_24453/g.62396 Transcript_24453/m.62396 type:complete len:294 (-) Transcript_24453:495-1376(-)